MNTGFIISGLLLLISAPAYAKHRGISQSLSIRLLKIVGLALLGYGVVLGFINF